MPEKICSTDGCENVVTANKRSKCAKCSTARHQVWRQANIEKAREYEQQWRARQADHLREYEKSPKRREKQNEARRRKLSKNPEARQKAAERSKAYYYAHRDDPEWRAKANSRERSADDRRKYTLKSRYKMTPEDYAALVEAQNGVCAICSREPTEKEGKLGVDHNHKTGAVRQLLCRYCNHLVDILEDKGELVLRAYQYIARHAIQSTE